MQTKRQQGKAHAEVGLLLWGAVRDSVKSLRHAGYRIEVEEGSGWFSRTFYFRGDMEALQLLLNWFKKLEEEEEDGA